MGFTKVAFKSPSGGVVLALSGPCGGSVAMQRVDHLVPQAVGLDPVDASASLRRLVLRVDHGDPSGGVEGTSVAEGDGRVADLSEDLVDFRHEGGLPTSAQKKKFGPLMTNGE